METIPYYLRIVGLLLFVVLILLYDRRHPPEKRYRLREYSFLLGVGAFGAIFGSCVDLVTSTVSPDYFAIGKGIGEGPSFRVEVLKLGAEAGFTGAVLGAGILLVVNRNRVAMSSLVKMSAIAFLISLITGTILGSLQHRFLIFRSVDLEATLDEESLRLFDVAWSSHVGIYAGALLGLMIASARILFSRHGGSRAECVS